MRLIALLLPALLPAVELTIRDADEPVRGGIPWRAVVEVTASPSPQLVTLTLREGPRVLAEATVSSPNGTIAFAVIPQEPTTATATLSIASAGQVVERTVPTRAGLEQRAATVAQAINATTSPLARLRLIQAVALLSKPQPTAADCRRAGRLLEQSSSEAAPDGELAVSDTVDGSVHPLRLYRPTSTAHGTVVWLRGCATTGPATWPEPPAAVIAAAQASGWWLVEPYPAGDVTWTGVGQRRLDAALAVAHAAGAPAEQLQIVADPIAVPGAARWPTVPTSRRMVRPDQVPTFEPGELLPAQAQPTGLGGYARGRFVVVTGSGEHRAATLANERLAQTFVQAWARHAHSRAVIIADTAFVAEAWADATIICCGTPRSHTILAPLAATLPLTWDERALRWTAADGTTQMVLRGQRRAVALAIARDAQPDLILLDGDWTFTPGLAPLADLTGTCAIGDGHGGWVLLR